MWSATISQCLCSPNWLVLPSMSIKGHRFFHIMFSTLQSVRIGWDSETPGNSKTFVLGSPFFKIKSPRQLPAPDLQENVKLGSLLYCFQVQFCPSHT